MVLNLDRYVEASSLLGPLLTQLQPQPLDPTSNDLPDACNAVYIATSAAHEVLYVGSVARGRPNALRCRISEHLKLRPGATEWANLWVLRLADDRTRPEVRWAEGRVGRFLNPADNIRLPRFPL
jgi:hypothetical protein